MFTGIIEATSQIKKIFPLEWQPPADSSSEGSEDHRAFVLELDAIDLYKSCKIGDSIAVNGCCLTLTENPTKVLQFVVSYETWALTTFSKLKAGDLINLERAMLLHQRLDGHIVSGHVDTSCRVSRIIEMGASKDLFICIPSVFAHLCIQKGSITLDGVSLTINDIAPLSTGDSEVRITLIPHTISVTRFCTLRENSYVNVEFDLLGKYVQRLMEKN